MGDTYKILLICVAMVIGLALFAIWACCRVSGECAREEENRKPKEDPCETCLRWEECNGVDQDCPRR